MQANRPDSCLVLAVLLSTLSVACVELDEEEADETSIELELGEASCEDADYDDLLDNPKTWDLDMPGMDRPGKGSSRRGKTYSNPDCWKAHVVTLWDSARTWDLGPRIYPLLWADVTNAEACTIKTRMIVYQFGETGYHEIWDSGTVSGFWNGFECVYPDIVMNPGIRLGGVEDGIFKIAVTARAGTQTRPVRLFVSDLPTTIPPGNR